MKTYLPDMTPAVQPEDTACPMHPLRSLTSIAPVVASTPAKAGLPITSLLRGTPEAAISNNDELGNVEDDEVSRPEHVVYSVAPSVKKCACDEQIEVNSLAAKALLTVIELDVVLQTLRRTLRQTNLILGVRVYSPNQ